MNKQVTSIYKITIFLKSTVYIAINFKPILTNQNFLFYLSHLHVTNTIITAKLPKVIIVINPINNPIIIRYY